jgi:hypothetical protein
MHTYMNTGVEPRRSPYQGLIPYTEEDAAFFFGRERDAQLIIANLFGSPLTIVFGPSGVGKSSVLRAGVVHQLAHRPDLHVIYHSVWKDNPLDRLKAALVSLPDVKHALDPTRSLAELLMEYNDRSERRLMILFDQFEEYFLYHPGEDDFTVQFSKAVMQPDIPVSFLISLREDALAKLDRFEGRIPILFDNTLRLEHLTEPEARSAIENPIEKYNELYRAGKEPIRIEPALVNEVVRQLMSGRVSLNRAGLGVISDDSMKRIETPYLQLVMMRLWDEEMRLGSNQLRLGSLKSLGGTEKIVRSHLDAVMKRLTNKQRVLASKVFQYLVTPSGTKIALNADDLAGFAESQVQPLQSLLQRLTQQDVRLLRPVDTKDKSELSYEIFHDVLAAPILDWRARFVRSRRYRDLAIIAVIAVLLTTLCGVLSFAFERLGRTPDQPVDLAYGLLVSIFGAVLTAFYCIVPIIIGIFIGRRWSRA